MNQCKERVQDRDTTWPRYHQCQRKATHGEYCKIHSPEAVAARRKASDERGEKEWRKRKLEIYGPKFFAALVEIAGGHNDPRSLAFETIKDFQ